MVKNKRHTINTSIVTKIYMLTCFSLDVLPLYLLPFNDVFCSPLCLLFFCEKIFPKCLLFGVKTISDFSILN